MTSEEIIARQGEIEQRKLEIDAALEQPEADLDALGEEARQLMAEKATLDSQLEELKKKAEEAEEARKAVENGAGEVKNEFQEEKKMTELELRGSAEYMDAFAKYLKGEIVGKADDAEVRSLLTTNAVSPQTGYVPVPTLVDDIVRHAWENEEILARVKKTGFTGNVKVAFELSADGAYIHAEGTSAPTEEALTLGIVEIKPQNIKKWISISDEMLETTGEGFVRYVYEELAYQVLKKLSYDIVNDIAACAYTTNQSTAVGIPKVNKDPGLGTIYKAVCSLNDEARNLCVIVNPLTKSNFKDAYIAGNFPDDPFEGLPVLTSGKLPAFDAASANDTYAIVGDLSAVQVNFPAGEGLKMITDPYSLAEKDLVKLVGRVYAGHNVVAPGRLVRLTKQAGAVTT
jgi:HK97 family phage major capsid protein